MMMMMGKRQAEEEEGGKKRNDMKRKRRKRKKRGCDNRLCLGRWRGRREEEGWEMLERCKSMTEPLYEGKMREEL